MKEYFDIYDSGYKALGFPVGGLIFIVISIVLIIYGAKTKQVALKGFAIFMLIFASLWTSVSAYFITRDYLSLISVMDEKRYSEVEGYVENFDPMPSTGHKYESFTVKGVKFQYSDFVVTPGFRNAKSKGGPIDSGKYVRIRYYDGIILQLWVKE